MINDNELIFCVKHIPRHRRLVFTLIFPSNYVDNWGFLRRRLGADQDIYCDSCFIFFNTFIYVYLLRWLNQEEDIYRDALLISYIYIIYKYIFYIFSSSIVTERDTHHAQHCDLDLAPPPGNDWVQVVSARAFYQVFMCPGWARPGAEAGVATPWLSARESSSSR